MRIAADGWRRSETVHSGSGSDGRLREQNFEENDGLCTSADQKAMSTRCSRKAFDTSEKLIQNFQESDRRRRYFHLYKRQTGL